jgi:hypothetical protein
MRTKGNAFDQVILYLVAGVVVVGFISFGVYDVLGGRAAKAHHPEAGAAKIAITLKANSGTTSAPLATTITTPAAVPMPRIPKPASSPAESAGADASRETTLLSPFNPNASASPQTAPTTVHGRIGAQSVGTVPPGSTRPGGHPAPSTPAAVPGTTTTTTVPVTTSSSAAARGPTALPALNGATSRADRPPLSHGRVPPTAGAPSTTTTRSDGSSTSMPDVPRSTFRTGAGGPPTSSGPSAPGTTGGVTSKPVLPATTTTTRGGPTTSSQPAASISTTTQPVKTTGRPTTSQPVITTQLLRLARLRQVARLRRCGRW